MKKNKQHNGNPDPSDSTENSDLRLRRPGSSFFLPHKLFLVVAIPFGILFTFLTPPFLVPDEPAHLLRSWQIAEGHIHAEMQNHIAGGFFPKGLIQVVFSMDHVRGGRPRETSITSFQQIRSLLDIPFAPQSKEFVPVLSAVYSPVPYLPQTAAMILAKPFQFHPLLLMYWVRMVNLLAWVGLIYAAIRIIPIYPTLFMLLALTPMSLHQAASVSADAMINGLAFLSIALALRMAAVHEKPIRPVVLVGFGVCVVLLSLCKNVYVFFGLLLFLAPAANLGGLKRYWGYFVLLMGVCFVLTAGWSISVAGLYTFNKNPALQMEFIRGHILDYAGILAQSMLQQSWYLRRAFVGLFGWTDVWLGTWHIRLWLVLLVTTALLEHRRGYSLCLRQKAVCLLLFAGETVLIFTLLYVFWNPVGADNIRGVQGRYFIPIVPLLLLALYNTKLNIPIPRLSLWAAVCTILSLCNAAQVIYHRFY
jgi:uncharacterized membrane protein